MASLRSAHDMMTLVRLVISKVFICFAGAMGIVVHS